MYIFIVMTTKENTRHIQAKAIRERILFKQIKNQLNAFCLKFTPYNGTDSHDVTFKQFNLKQFKITTAMAEIKVRECSIKSFNGYVIEKSKYDYLMANAKQYDNLYYINFFHDGFMVWDLKTISPDKINWKENEYRENNQDSFTKYKIAADLMTWDAAIIVYDEFKTTETLWKSYQIWDRINKRK